MIESFAAEGERLLALIFVLNSEGFRVNNLFQLPGTLQWQANLTDGKKLWEFGHGSTPVAALEAAKLALAGEGTLPLEPSGKKPSTKVTPPLKAILSLDLEL